MSFLRFIVGIISILTIFFVVSLLLPSTLTLSKAILINAPQTLVNKEIQDLAHWKNWYPAFQNEPGNVIKNSAKRSVINSVTFKSDKGKPLVFDLIKSQADTSVIVIESASSTKVSYQFIVSSNGNGQTKLVWNVNTYLGWYPWQKVKGIFLDKISGPQYDAALAKLKNAVEK